jgi:hypothetical protein
LIAIAQVAQTHLGPRQAGNLFSCSIICHLLPLRKSQAVIVACSAFFLILGGFSCVYL